MVGSKRVLLVDPVWNDNLYPFDDQLLFNTAQVDPENPIYEKFPKFADVEFIECILEPGTRNNFHFKIISLLFYILLSVLICVNKFNNLNNIF